MADEDVRNWTREDYERAAQEYWAQRAQLDNQVDPSAEQLEKWKRLTAQRKKRADGLKKLTEREKRRADRYKQLADEAEREVLRLRALVKKLQSRPGVRKKRKS